MELEETMSKRPACPPGTPWMMPMLTVKDVDAALAFYQKAFGIEKRMALPGPDGRTAHAELAWRDAIIMLGPETPDRPVRAPATSGVPSPVGLHLYCDDVDALFARATRAGAKVMSPPEDMFWGDRMCRLSDPDGHAWAFATNVADFDPSKVPH
jgi:PhnB protein